jgi:ATP-dependent exoDNAse (exonuclease V) alpha subunit
MIQTEALDILKSGENVFLTGRAGSGKTYLLERFILSLRFRKIPVGVTASTGVAATHLSGMTINSWAGIGVKSFLTDDEIETLLKRSYLRKRFTETKALIIDEVSMLSSHTFETVDRLLRVFKNKDEPFGGMQVVLSGDFFQLPPVGEGSSDIDFVYKSPLWKELDLKVCYLDKPYRQDDHRFLSLLDDIRENNVTQRTWDTLKACFLQERKSDILPAKLYTHNAHADIVNASELAKIPGVSRTFLMRTNGNPSLAYLLVKNCLAPERLVLKIGAQVMFVKNNREAGYANGTMGKVSGFDEKGIPIVQTYNGEEITAYAEEWEIEEDDRVVARITQIPLRLAWAITIHKSQGMSLDAAEIDLGKSFVQGMGYVALSRVRTLEGIKLRSVNRTALMVNDGVRKFDRQLREESEELVQELRNTASSKKLLN